ncbi:MAG: hypothetical protein JW861_04305 [Bacteroidales bacterium]|nr:hypothetical protein [Bacteroidales bacterium]
MTVSLDHKTIRATGELLAGLKIRPGFYRREFVSFNADRETKLRVYLLSSAICHQTHSLAFPEKNLYGWEYLEDAFLRLVNEGAALLNPKYTSICSLEELEYRFRLMFSPTGNPEDTALERVGERARLALGLYRGVKEQFGGSVSQMIDGCGGLLVNEGIGLYEVLGRFEAFSDPFRKKSGFFLKLARDAGLIRIADPEHLVPIMDYHMQRVLLRMGCVVTDPDTRRRLTARDKMETDDPIREACIEAVRMLSRVSGHDILVLNDFLWPLGRSCCNETTLCHEGYCTRNPCTFYSMVNITSHRQCSFASTCRGSREESFRRIWQPVVKTHYY